MLLLYWVPPPTTTPSIYLHPKRAETSHCPPPISAAAAATTRREHAMAGLSVILDQHRDLSAKKSPLVISKGRMIKPPSSPSPPSPSSTPPLSPSGVPWTKTLTNLSFSSGFLDCCFLCKQQILPGKDIYMYKGDRAFCSVECRCRQILMDEEQTVPSVQRKVVPHQ